VGSLTTRELARELVARGWVERKQGRGSHRLFAKAGRRERITLPVKLKRGVALSVIAILERDEEAANG
jgi:predicted RNA binding protein YcfA (HicA-like mRNA interferase family)